MSWSGSVSLSNGGILEDVFIHAPASQLPFPDKASLRFLSVVEIAKIPLHLAIGSPCSVHTADTATESWFLDILLDTAVVQTNIKPWWQAARTDSPLGILVAVDSASTQTNPSSARVTELLFYASRGRNKTNRPPTPPPSSPTVKAQDDVKDASSLHVDVIALSSDLLASGQYAELTPPASPRGEQAEIEAIFLLDKSPSNLEVINEPPVRKRRSATDAFDEANERRKKARRRGGEGVAAAAATKSDSQAPSLKHRHSVSGAQPIHIQTRPLSGSPSVASSRPPTAVPAELKRSALARSESSPALQVDCSTEKKNKDLISRIVMAGMRLYGLSQSKRRTRKSDVTHKVPRSNIKDEASSKHEVDERNDEEYKLVYHQAFKATCFAFRASLTGQSLYTCSEAVRDVSDKLLNLFCSGPMSQGFSIAGVDKLTPGGRKAFGTAPLETDVHGQISLCPQYV